MRKRSLRGRLLILWSISFVSALAVGAMLVQLYRQSSIEQVARAQAVVQRACGQIADRYRFYTTGWHDPPANLHADRLHSDLVAVLDMALAGAHGVEGGIWQPEAGSLAYAYPTYEGSGPKSDLPAAEEQRIRSVNAEALSEERPVDFRHAGRSQILLLHACPLEGPISAATAWTMTRVYTGEGGSYTRLTIGLGVLMLSVLASAAWLTLLLLTWSRKLGLLEATIAHHGGLDLPQLEPTGERELDRIVSALNAASAEIGAVRRRAEALSRRVAASERLAALGRMSAGIAHEIRNPIAAMRLKAESALAADDPRRRAALEAILGQITRLDALLGDLLTLTHRVEPRRQMVDVPRLLATSVGFHQEIADRQGVTLRVEWAADQCWIDPEQIRRALDNLLLNAIQNTPPGGNVAVAAHEQDGALHITVADTGPGLPDEIRAHLFEPFASGRADGTGLGLSIVKEIAEAHGGSVGCGPGNPGSTFELVLPCRSSSS